MAMARKPDMGKAIKLLGWLIVAYYAITYTLATYDTLADASVRAYAVLLIFEGVVHIAVGLFLVWLGARIAVRAETSDKATNDQDEP